MKKFQSGEMKKSNAVKERLYPVNAHALSMSAP